MRVLRANGFNIGDGANITSETRIKLIVTGFLWFTFYHKVIDNRLLCLLWFTYVRHSKTL